jgi:hypothetical protein
MGRARTPQARQHRCPVQNHPSRPNRRGTNGGYYACGKIRQFYPSQWICGTSLHTSMSERLPFAAPGIQLSRIVSCSAAWEGPSLARGWRRRFLGGLARSARLQVPRCPQRLNHQGHYNGRIRDDLHLGRFRLHLAQDTASSKVRPDTPPKCGRASSVLNGEAVAA